MARRAALGSPAFGCAARACTRSTFARCSVRHGRGGATTVGRRGPVRLRARTATGLKGSDCAGMPFAIVLLNPPRPMAFCGPQPTETRTHHADKCSSILVSHPRDHKCSVVNPNMLGQLHSGASIRVVPAGPRGTAAAPAHRAQDRVCSAWRTRLVTHARTPRSRAPPSSTRFPPTRPGVVRAVHARPRGPTRLTKDAAVLAVRTKAQ